MAICTCRIDSCLGCIPLQRGAIIVGFFYMCGSMLETFKYMYGLVELELRVQQCAEAEPKRSLEMYFKDFQGPIYSALKDNPRFCHKGKILALARSSLVVLIFIFFIHFILTALMVHGVRRDRPKLIAPWLWWQFSLFVVTILNIISLQSVREFLFSVSVLMVAVYLFMVVNSYYLELLRQQRNPSRVTVITMAHHPRSEMMVSIPSPLKDDPPPPYNSCYVPSEPIYPPPYNAASSTYPTMPPPYQSVDPLMPSVSGSSGMQEDPRTTTHLATGGSSGSGGTPSSPDTPLGCGHSWDLEGAQQDCTGTANDHSNNSNNSIANTSAPITSSASTGNIMQTAVPQEPNTGDPHVMPDLPRERMPLVVKLPSENN